MPIAYGRPGAIVARLPGQVELAGRRGCASAGRPRSRWCPLSQVRMASSAASSSRTPTRYCGAIGSRSVVLAARPSSPASRPSAPGTSPGTSGRSAASSSGSSASSARLGVADHRHLGGHPAPGPGRVGLDLHDPHLARLRQVLGVREVRADHEQRVDVVHQRPRTARCRAARSRRWCTGESSGTTRLAGQRLDDRGAQHLGRPRAARSRACRAPAPARIATLLTGVEHVGGRVAGPRRRGGPAGGQRRSATVAGGRAGATCRHGSASASATWMSFGTVRWATPRRA